MNYATKRRTRNLSGVTVAALAIALTGCDVQQTQAGELPDVDVDAGDLPNYEIVKTDDGELPSIDVDGGQLPAFDVDWMDVDVGLTETTVDVPKLKLVVEEETVKIPKIDVDWPGEEEVRERTIHAQLETVGSGQDLQIERIYAADDELIVVSRLTGNASGGTPERLSDYVVVSAPDMDVEHYVIGSAPRRDFNDDLDFVDDFEELADEIRGARLLYERK